MSAGPNLSQATHATTARWSRGFVAVGWSNGQKLTGFRPDTGVAEIAQTGTAPAARDQRHSVGIAVVAGAEARVQSVPVVEDEIAGDSQYRQLNTATSPSLWGEQAELWSDEGRAGWIGVAPAPGSRGTGPGIRQCLAEGTAAKEDLGIANRAAARAKSARHRC